MTAPVPDKRPPTRCLVIVGAGPAGLTAGCEALDSGWNVTVLEKDPDYVGGISRTVRHGDYRFDIGGHRFFSKSEEVTAWWRRRLPDDFIKVRRMSRIYYRRRFFDYPLKPWNALSNLGFFTSAGCILSYGWSRLFPRSPERSFEDWVTNRFGRRLFRIFFKTYTEKIWGISTAELECGLGRAAHQGPLALQGHPGGVARQAGIRRPRHQDACRQLRVPPPWARPNVGKGGFRHSVERRAHRDGDGGC